MQKLYILCGVGFSGKSTLARKITEYKNAILVSQDDIWFEKAKECNLDEDSDEDWDMVLQISKQRVRDKLSHGNSVVFDHVNLRHSHREELRDVAKEYGAQAVVVYLDTSFDIQKERWLKNIETQERHNVEQKFLDEAIKELEIPHVSENTFIFTPDTDIAYWLDKLP